jgi:hypothetical protein
VVVLSVPLRRGTSIPGGTRWKLGGAAIAAEAVFQSLHQPVNANAHLLHRFVGFLLPFLKVAHVFLKALHAGLDLPQVGVETSLRFSKGNLIERHLVDNGMKFAHPGGGDSLLFQQKLHGFFDIHCFYSSVLCRGLGTDGSGSPGRRNRREQ